MRRGSSLLPFLINLSNSSIEYSSTPFLLPPASPCVSLAPSPFVLLCSPRPAISKICLIRPLSWTRSLRAVFSFPCVVSFAALAFLALSTFWSFLSSRSLSPLSFRGPPCVLVFLFRGPSSSPSSLSPGPALVVGSGSLVSAPSPIPGLRCACAGSLSRVQHWFFFILFPPSFHLGAGRPPSSLHRSVTVEESLPCLCRLVCRFFIFLHFYFHRLSLPDVLVSPRPSAGGSLVRLDHTARLRQKLLFERRLFLLGAFLPCGIPRLLPLRFLPPLPLPFSPAPFCTPGGPFYVHPCAIFS